MTTRDDLSAALSHPNVAAFLCVIDRGEHGRNADSPDRYRTQFGGGLFDAPPWEHPRTKVTAGRWTSTAAGRGQFLAGTWDALVARYRFPDFSPDCQDEGIVALIAGRKALDDVIAGRFESAVEKCNKEWASLPGSPYGQPTMTLDEARDIYTRHGGLFEPADGVNISAMPDARDGGSVNKSPDSADKASPAFNPDSLATEHYGEAIHESTAPREEAPMAFPLIPLITAFGPQLLQLIPQLGSLFGSGSDVQVRNVKAATMAVDAIVKATDSPNLQAAVEKMQEDPDVARTARAAVAEVMTLIEVGGGIVEARKAAYSPDQMPPWKNPAVWVAGAVLPLVYMVAAAVLFGIGGQTWSDDIKTLLVTAIVTGALGSITGFFLGSSLGSQRKTEMK